MHKKLILKGSRTVTINIPPYPRRLRSTHLIVIRENIAVSSAVRYEAIKILLVFITCRPFTCKKHLKSFFRTFKAIQYDTAPVFSALGTHHALYLSLSMRITPGIERDKFRGKGALAKDAALTLRSFFKVRG